MKLIKRRGLHLNKFLLIILIFFIVLENYSYSQTRKNIKNKLNTIIKQKKYIYLENPELETPTRKQESFINRIIIKIGIFFLKIYAAFLKIFGSKFLAITIFILIFAVLIYLTFYIINKISFANIKKNKAENDTEIDHYSLDYNKELRYAEELINKGKHKEAVSRLLNAMWLFYHYHKLIIFNKGITNREYIEILKNQREYKLLQNIVFKAEKAVYSWENINKKDCEKILFNINSIFSR